MNPNTASKWKQTAREIGRAGLGWGKAQLIMLGVNFVVITVGMLFAGMHWWSPIIAVAVALVDMLPVIGSGVVFIPWTVLAVYAGNRAMALAVGVTYVVMVVLRMVLDPIITGKNVGLSPLVTLLSAVAGLILFGGAGLFLGPLIAAICNIIYQLHFKQSAPEPAAPAEPPALPEAHGDAPEAQDTPNKDGETHVS